MKILVDVGGIIKTPGMIKAKLEPNNKVELESDLFINRFNSFSSSSTGSINQEIFFETDRQKTNKIN